MRGALFFGFGAIFEYNKKLTMLNIFAYNFSKEYDILRISYTVYERKERKL